MSTQARIQWPDDIRDIGGLGDGYENACRRMTVAGVVWLTANAARVRRREEGEGFRFGRDDEDEKSARASFEDAVAAADPHCSGAQVGAAMSHACVIFWRGWAWYWQESARQKVQGG